MVLAHPEEVRQFLVVRREDLRLGGGDGHARDLPARARDLEDVVYVLDGAETLGEEAQGRRRLELRETRLKVELDGLCGPTLPSAYLRARWRVDGRRTTTTVAIFRSGSEHAMIGERGGVGEKTSPKQSQRKNRARVKSTSPPSASQGEGGPAPRARGERRW